ncbi:MAG: dipicolinate synthase subunit B [Oscillospiraceae bacterium]
MSKLRAGLALCGSYCTYDRTMAAAEKLVGRYDLMAIMSENAASTDTRFGKAADFIQKLEAFTGKPVITSIATAEHIGPKALLDVLVIAPCTGNTLAKLALGITDTSVTMAAKAHLRNGRPVVIAVSTNDGLSGSASNIGALLGRKNVYFVPFGQDDPVKKPCSLVADFTRIEDTIENALEGRQIQPILL